MRALNMVVCVKPVPDPRYWDRLSLDPQTKLLRREGVPIVLNPVDKNALEMALQTKESRGGQVTVVSMGPPNTAEVIAYAFAMGADHALLLSDKAFAGADTLATARALATGIRTLGEVGMVLLGEQSLDGGTGQVGPQVAEFLGIPCVTNVARLEFVDEETIRAASKIEYGHVVIETRLPAAIAVTKEANQPRLLPVLGALWATEKNATVKSAADLGVEKEEVGLAGSPTYVPEIANVEIQRKGEVLEGEPAEIARELVAKLRAAGVFS